jgi:hypothetical protein
MIWACCLIPAPPSQLCHPHIPNTTSLPSAAHVTLCCDSLFMCVHDTPPPPQNTTCSPGLCIRPDPHHAIHHLIHVAAGRQWPVPEGLLVNLQGGCCLRLMLWRRVGGVGGGGGGPKHQSHTHQVGNRGGHKQRMWAEDGRAGHESATAATCVVCRCDVVRYDVRLLPQCGNVRCMPVKMPTATSLCCCCCWN